MGVLHMNNYETVKYRKIGIWSYSISLAGTLIFLFTVTVKDQIGQGLAWEKQLSLFFSIACMIGAIFVLGIPLFAFFKIKADNLSKKMMILLYAPLIISIALTIIISLMDYFNLGI